MRIDEAAYEKLKKGIDRALDNKKPILCIHINSQGGEIRWAEEMVSLILDARASGLEVIGVAHHAVHSAALLPFIACTYRVSKDRDVQFLIHNAKQEGEDNHDITSKIGTRIADICKLTIAEYLKLAQKNSYLSLPQARELNILNFDFI